MAFKYNIIRAFEDERAEGIAEGIEKSMEDGQLLKLISMVRKKMHKGMPMEEIADILEEEETAIAPICALIQNHPDWEDKKVCTELANAEQAAKSQKGIKM